MTPRGSVRVKEGSLLNVSCEVAGVPQPSLTWQKISSSGSSQVIRSESPSLEMEMTSVGPEDEGTYVCVASSLAGLVEDSLQNMLVHKICENIKLKFSFTNYNELDQNMFKL